MNMPEIKNRCIDRHPEDIWTYKVIRPLSWYPTWVFLKLGIRANQITVCGFLLGILGCVLLAFGTHTFIILGALLINSNYLLDRCDGNVARMTNTTSQFGKILDVYCDYTIDTLAPVCIGIGLYLHPAFGIPSIAYLALGLSLSLIRSLRLNISSFTSSITKDVTSGIINSNNTVIKVGLAIIALSPIILLGFALGNALSIFLISYTLIAICELLIYSTIALTKARKDKK